MNLLSLISALEEPTGLWVTLINWIKGSVVNIGWTILLVTVLVKLITTPLDFLVKLNTKRQTLVQQKCAPEISKLQKKYGNDKQRLQMQTQSIYKREGLKMGTGCIVMLVNLILSFTIFFTFYSSLRKVSAYEAIYQYEQVKIEYETAFKQSLIDNNTTEEVITAENVDEFVNEESETYIAFCNNNVALITKATEDGTNAAVRYWNEHKSSWLWIQNIWVADSNTAPFPYYATLQSIAKNGGYTEYFETINKDDYSKIATLINKNAERKDNGFFILAILAGVITLASQFVTNLHNKLKNKNANKLAKTASSQIGSTMKLMMFIMPVIMVIFVLSTSASFGIYILASNLATIAFGEIVTIIVDAMTKKQRLEVEESLEKEANKLIKKGKL